MKNTVQRDEKKEFFGWIYLTLIMLLFPVLFFICVFLPMMVGWVER
jgi:nitrogen fixation protein FixH